MDLFGENPLDPLPHRETDHENGVKRFGSEISRKEKAPVSTVVVLVPMLNVKSVPRSMEFYGRLGFAAQNTHKPDGEPEPVWAWLRSNAAQLMVAQASQPVNPEQQGVLFYLYVPDVAAYREELAGDGLKPGEIQFPFYAPRGEFRLTDPDGYTLMISHT